MVSIIICILFLCFILYHVSSINTLSEKSLTGFWEADSSFCEESDIDMMCMFIGEKKGSKRPFYLLVKKDDDMIINELGDVKFTQQIYSNPCDNIKKTYTAVFDIENENFPSSQEMYYYVTSNKIILFKGDNVYAVLYKNPALTEINTIKQENNTKKDL